VGLCGRELGTGGDEAPEAAGGTPVAPSRTDMKPDFAGDNSGTFLSLMTDFNIGGFIAMWTS
jgi:hypothetical protein